MVNLYKIGDTVYHKNFKLFGVIVEYRVDDVEKFYRVRAINSTRGLPIKSWTHKNIVLVNPDTPQNRLAIQLKYGT